MGFQEETELKQAVFISLHYAAGLLALGIALFYLLSDTLPSVDGIHFGTFRVRAPVCAFFLIAAYLLLSSARQLGFLVQKVVGYACIALGFVAAWFILGGSSIGV